MSYVDVIKYALISRLYVFTLLLRFLFYSMIYFVNTLYFTLVLMLSVVSFSVYSVYLGVISSLFAVVLIIIYVGAMMIFIGYICAISPNILLTTSFPFFASLSLIPFSFLFIPLYPFFNSNLTPFTDFLYSSSGVFLFVLVAVVLFLVLMVVSSQFFSPQGPFRSVT